MERLAILVAESRTQKGYPALGWVDVWLYGKEGDEFDVALFNYDEFLEGKELVCPKARKRDTPTIFFGHPTTEANYKRLAHDLLHLGYRLITSPFDAYNVDDFRWFRILKNDPYEPYRIPSRSERSSVGGGTYGAHAPSIYFVRDSDGYVDGDYSAFTAIGWKTSGEMKEMVERFKERRGNRLAGKVFFEQYIPIREKDGVPVVWRAFYFDGVCFHLAPLHDDAKHVQDFPKPPEEALTVFSTVSYSPFFACDFALSDGGWKVTRAFDGQMTDRPYGGREASWRSFCDNLAKVVAESPHNPEWIWCLTARVRDENFHGEEKKLVHGTRHFAPGTKVYLAPPNWDERVEVIGVPRYVDHPIKMVMWARKLEDFKCEKVSDPEIVAGLTERSQWPFTRFAEHGVGRGWWDDTDESRKRAEDDAEWLSGLDPNGKRWS